MRLGWSLPVACLIDVQKFFLSTKGHSRSTFAAARYIGFSLVTKVYAELENQPTVLQSRQKALESLNFEWVT
jgi:hypothetical protein